MPTLPPFDQDGLLPLGDYELSLEELRESILVSGPGDPTAYPSWDRPWREHLVHNLGTLTHQLWQVGVHEIFADGSFAEDKDHPNDIDGYFVCDLKELAPANWNASSTSSTHRRCGHGIPRRESLTAAIPKSSSPCGTNTAWNYIRTCRVSVSAAAFLTSMGTNWNSRRRFASAAGTANRGAS